MDQAWIILLMWAGGALAGVAIGRAVVWWSTGGAQRRVICLIETIPDDTEWRASKPWLFSAFVYHVHCTSSLTGRHLYSEIVIGSCTDWTTVEGTAPKTPWKPLHAAWTADGFRMRRAARGAVEARDVAVS